jgi:hypothetical protein
MTEALLRDAAKAPAFARMSKEEASGQVAIAGEGG